MGPANCAAGVQICGANCCTGPAAAFACENGACIPINGAPAPPASTSVTISTSVTAITLVTTSPAGKPTETPPPNTTVSVPVVAPSVTTINVTSWSTTAFPTGNQTTETGTGASHTHSANATETSGESKPTGAAGMLLPGSGLLGAAVAAALGAL
ncbi:uncharacterized protein N0V89_005213 [Didymosphaeria variabile]|uniref:Uncharacterized protein n=1 Tax=Didymosphaeria variabile TaxID=1932322 RepID=A0A9W9CBJ2_9PLEO|nr:uncharacterized protein N0V89_005213 [Didymosphaeria variabile]KAJ4353483.1 hypothetical protein N0V89_005213 [Didymosphaeria variabile]